jgi:uncharacterized protein (TIGR04551 family)
MRRGALAAASLASLSLCAPGAARATGFTDLGQDIQPRAETTLKLEGYYRARGEVLNNLDLDRGLTPSGQPLFPVPASEGGQTLFGGDMRLRTDLSVFAPGQSLAVRARIDTLDNVAAGSTTQGNYAAATSQQSPAAAIRVKRAYGMVLTPIGLLTAGRQGNHWGLGMLANGGDCADCNSGDSADRLAFVTPLGGLIWAAAYDLSASGPVRPRRDGVRALDVEPTDNVQAVTFAVMRYRDDAARDRRRRAGVETIDYGAYVAHKWQQSDIPSSYLPTASPVPLTAAQVVPRGYTATAIDGWARLITPSFRLEVEAALVNARVDQISVLPGVSLRDPVYSRQIGVAVESEIGSPDGPLGAGLDGGYASGDPAPGFGAFPDANGKAGKPGDLDGAQANPPRDARIDNFRFSPDYRIDRILWREIVGTVTDAVYVRPHARLRLAESASGALTAQVAAVASWALEATSTPGGKSPLGLEIDPTLAYQSRDGFGLAVDHGILFPWSGLDNPGSAIAPRQTTRPAQVIRMRLMFRF